MAGIRHIGDLANVETLQYRKDVLGPGSGVSGCVGAGVHVSVQSAGGRERQSAPVMQRDCRRSGAFHQSAKTAYSSAIGSSAIEGARRWPKMHESWRRVSIWRS